MESDTLSKAAEAERSAWLETCKASPLVTALFAGAEAQLLYSGTPAHGSEDVRNALRVLAYSGLLSNLGATVSAMFMLDMLGHIIVKAQKNPELNLKGSEPHKTISNYMWAHGIGLRWMYLQLHLVVSLILGSGVMFAQVVVLAYVVDGSGVGKWATVFGAWGLSPLPVYFVLSFIGGCFRADQPSNS